jgi:hypothetical protein
MSHKLKGLHGLLQDSITFILPYRNVIIISYVAVPYIIFCISEHIADHSGRAV